MLLNKQKKVSQIPVWRIVTACWTDGTLGSERKDEALARVIHRQVKVTITLYPTTSTCISFFFFLGRCGSQGNFVDTECTALPNAFPKLFFCYEAAIASAALRESTNITAMPFSRCHGICFTYLAESSSRIIDTSDNGSDKLRLRSETSPVKSTVTEVR